jgi:ABC-2 type transport system ATP-binding protein
LVFLDEPTGGVDPITRRAFWDMLNSAASAGITVFVTTHYLDEAEYCDRISIMAKGKIGALGTPTELKEQFRVPSIYEVILALARGNEA